MTSDVREGVRHPPTPLRGTNLFDALRIIAAAMVIIGHAWPLSGLSGVPTFAGMKIRHVGVYIFFVISGYLLARSWNRDPRPLAFIVRRALRIFPALFAVILLTILVVGPLLTVQPPGGYWGQRSFWNYFMNFLLLAEYELPGVFVNNPTPPVNGSLWSLGPEFCC